MQYFVIGADGSKYGPGDIPTLKQWVAENRIAHNTILENSSTGQRLQASQFQELFPPAQTQYAQPVGGQGPSHEQPYAQYPQPAYYPRPANPQQTKQWVTLSWIFSSIGFLCCPIVLCMVGIVFAVIAMVQGHKTAWIPLVYGIVMLVAGTVAGIAANQWTQEFLRQLQRGR